MKDDDAPDPGRQRLIDSLWQDARREAEQEVQKARSEGEGLLNKARLFHEREMALAVEKARREATPRVSRILNQARNRARQLLLEERIAFLGSCFDEVAERVRREDGFKKKARASLPHLLDQAIAAMGDPGKIEARVNPEDADSARSALEGKGIEFGLVSDDSVTGGVVLNARDGQVVVDDSVEGRLGALREAPPIELLRLICPGQDG